MKFQAVRTSQVRAVDDFIEVPNHVKHILASHKNLKHFEHLGEEAAIRIMAGGASGPSFLVSWKSFLEDEKFVEERLQSGLYSISTFEPFQLGDLKK